MNENILNVIENNARVKSEEIAAATGMTADEIRAEVRKYEDAGVICGYHTVINWDKTGTEKADAFIEVKVVPQKGVGFEQIAERISQYEEVNSIFLMSGNCDFIVHIKGQSMREIAMFVTDKLSTIEGVLSTMTQFVLKKYKQEGFRVEYAERDSRVEIS